MVGASPVSGTPISFGVSVRNTFVYVSGEPAQRLNRREGRRPQTWSANASHDTALDIKEANANEIKPLVSSPTSVCAVMTNDDFDRPAEMNNIGKIGWQTTGIAGDSYFLSVSDGEDKCDKEHVQRLIAHEAHKQFSVKNTFVHVDDEGDFLPTNRQPRSRTGPAAISAGLSEFTDSDIQDDDEEEDAEEAQKPFLVKNTFVHVDDKGDCLPTDRQPRSITGPATVYFAAGEVTDSDTQGENEEDDEERTDADVESDDDMCKLPSIRKVKTHDHFESPCRPSLESFVALQQQQQQQSMLMMAAFFPPTAAPQFFAVPPNPFTFAAADPDSARAATVAAQAAASAEKALRAIETTFAQTKLPNTAGHERRQFGLQQSKPRQQSSRPRQHEARHSQQPQKPQHENDTTLVLRNLPLNYRRNMLLKMLDREGFAGDYDFVYLPVDFETGAGLGYGFINLVTPEAVSRFWKTFEGYNRWIFPSAKTCTVCWSKPHQGLAAHVKRFRNSPLMHDTVPDEYRPMLFTAGSRVAFPPPTRDLWAPDFIKGWKNSKASQRAGV